MDNTRVAHELLAAVKELLSMDFPTQDAMDKYLKEHPDADKSNHRVVKHDPSDMSTHPFNLMRQRQNEKAMAEMGRHFKKDPKDLTVDEIMQYNQKRRGASRVVVTSSVRELLAVAKSLTAAMPSRRDGGRIKRAVGLILRKNGWSDYSIFESRNGSGYEIHAWRDVEQLPDISIVPGARTNDDLAREFDKEQKALSSVLERSLPIPAQEVVVNIRLNRQRDGTKAKLYAYLKYGEGFYVTPIEIL